MIKLSLGRVWGCLLIGVLISLNVPLTIRAQGFETVAWERVLRNYVDSKGWVDYGGLKSHAKELDTFVAQLGNHGPTVTPELFATRSDSLAFWLNAYNALVLFGVKEAYPVTSVTQILPDFGFFKEKKFWVDGQMVTLDQIEHHIVRPYFQDARIHAALNCGAQSCPKLHNTSFEPKKIEEQLHHAMAEMVGSTQHVEWNEEQNTLYLSQIFSWFHEDFVGSSKDDPSYVNVALVQYINAFLPTTKRIPVAQAQQLKLVFKTYDWSLNDQSLIQQ